VASDLGEALAARGVPWPGPLHYLPVVGSTNDWLKAQARAGAPPWTAVLAGRQTAGHGREGRPWESPPGNLFVSVLAPPALAPASVLVLPLAVGVAVAEAVEEHGVKAALKWPNDLIAEGGKLGGILVEALSGATGPEALVVGIGVNLALDPATLPASLREGVTSVRALAGRAPGAVDAAAAVLARLRHWYDAVRQDTATVLAAWRRRSLPWWGRPVEARLGESLLRGIARDVDDRGALILELEDGTRAALLAGEVREVRAFASR
jgi:BirA family biotin operon repressor/biotin-[acetyl-CoA-carboxylase] ligase